MMDMMDDSSQSHSDAGRRLTAIDWAALASQLPDGKDPASAASRRALFSRIDRDGRGRLTLSNLVNGLREEFSCCDELFESNATLMRAFRAAKLTSTSSIGGEWLERREFCKVLAYVRRYYELKVAFDRLEESNHIRKLSKAEFKTGLAVLGRWGIAVAPAAVDVEFQACDYSGSGLVTFDEICDCSCISTALEPGDVNMRGMVSGSGACCVHVRVHAALPGGAPHRCRPFGGWLNPCLAPVFAQGRSTSSGLWRAVQTATRPT